MITRSARFDKALTQDHQEIFRADLWFNNEKIREIEVLSGSLTVDGTAQVLRRTDMVLSGHNELNIPGYAFTDSDRLWPVGSLIKLYSGIKYGDGTEEFLPQGVFRTSKPRSVESNDGDLNTSLEGYDLSAQVSRNRWVDPWVVSAGANVRTEIIRILQDRLPNYTFDFSAMQDTAYTLPAMVLEHGASSDPWKQCQDMAISAGMELYFNVVGQPTMREVGVLQTIPDASYNEDDGDCTLLDAERDLDEERGYSGVVVTAQNPDSTPALAKVWDEDPTSATYVGSFGFVPYFINSQFVPDLSDGSANAPQALAVATSYLQEVRGIIENVGFSSIANFAHEQGDLVQIKRDRLKVNGMYVLESFTRSLEEGSAMQATTRKRRA